MERKIYHELIARLTDSDALAAFEKAQVAPLVTIAWFEGQIDQAVVEEGNVTYPFYLPALFIQFGETKYSGAPTRQKADGDFTLHVVQSKTGMDSREGGETHTEFKDLLNYADVIIDLLNSYKLTCSATPTLAAMERDHTNRPILVDQIKFSWSGSRFKA